MSGKGPIAVVVLSIIVMVVMGLISMLPTTVVLESTHSFSVSKEKLNSYFSSPELWKIWLINSEDPSIKFLQNGPVTGDGAGYKWFSDIQGDGAIEITVLSESRIGYELVTDNGQFRERGSFIFKTDTQLNSIAVTWQDTLDVSTNFHARYAANNDTFAGQLNTKNKKILRGIEKQINE